MNTRFIYSILLCFMVTVSTSCNKWLDVQPNSQIKSSELFSTESGFKEALAGVYTLMTEERLYGKELQYGMIGVLAQEWSAYDVAYTEDAAYEYESTNTQGRINNVWNGLYQAITNSNNLINSIEDKKSIFSGDNYAIIKGEGLAQRAFLHFELLRLFGASYLVDPNKPAIPYVVQYTPQQTAQSTVREAYDLILKDLEAAKELLKADPMLTGRVISEADDNGYLLNRQLHLNYYAVEALLARLYYNTGNFAKARTAANTVISSGKFSFSTQANIANGVDLTGAAEHIFGLQVNNLHTRSDLYLSDEGTRPFSLTAAALASYYESSSSDYRFSYLFKIGAGSLASDRFLLKYSAPIAATLYYRNKSALIKLSEMYFILAGCNLEENISLLDPLNKVRQARGLPAMTTAPTDPTATFISEFRKDFFGEGQLFHLYKRLNRTLIAGTDKNLVELRAYVLPLPVAEYESANRSPNR
ncbi:RagB/SusD family nutrient uptake outer membrane protein [Pedobacter sp. AW31-3R]|uniref:RagB/SusD family nutrient uptake outer membrane protein n=1 Tax=Pedobacter sp. AW31-3R TaxID=3445781 RepID=UPI003FA07C76